jgi:histidinol-phosphate aminotransferase
VTSPLLPLIKPELAPLKAYKAFADAYPAKLDANENPFPLPAEARARLAERLASVEYHRYPDAGAHALREALAARLGVADVDTLVLGVGSDEVLAMLMRVFSRPKPGKARAAVLYPDPSFVMYGMRSIVEDLEPVPVALDSAFQLDMAAMERAIGEKRPNLVFLATPNNPTGNCFRAEDVARTAELASDALVIVDEAYVAFSPGTLRKLTERFDNIAMMGTLSKIGFAAARVGWVELPRVLADEVEKARQPYNLNTLSQVVATLALGELWPLLEQQIAQVRDERARLAHELRSVPRLQVFPSDANFFLVRVDGTTDGLDRALRERGVSVRLFTAGRLEGHMRITVGTPEENALLVRSLHALLART